MHAPHRASSSGLRDIHLSNDETGSLVKPSVFEDSNQDASVIPVNLMLPNTQERTRIYLHCGTESSSRRSITWLRVVSTMLAPLSQAEYHAPVISMAC